MPRAISRSSSSTSVIPAATPSSSASSSLELGRDGRLRRAQLQRERDEPLLGAVVQVALDAAPRLVGGGDDARARRLQLGPALGVGDGGGDELGESAEALLGSRRRRVVAGRCDGHTPHRRPSTLIGAATAERLPRCPQSVRAVGVASS